MTHTDTISPARRQLLERLRRGELQVSNSAPEPAIPATPGAEGPLSPGQEQVWFHAQLAGSAPIYNESVTIHKRGPLDAGILERCFNEIARRHQLWQSAFPMIDGKVVQRVDPKLHVTIPFVDLSHLSAAERETESARIATEDVRRPFDLNVAPLFRLHLVRWSQDYHRIYLTVHHLAFDGVSIYRVMISELGALYNAYSNGRPSPLPELGVQFRDYAAWEQKHLSSTDHAAQLKYWRQTLSDGAPSLELPTDRPRRAQPTFSGGVETCTIPGALLARIKELARNEGATPYMILLAVFQVLLHRYSGQDEVVVGGATNTRGRPKLESLIGYFLNAVVYRTRVAGDPSFREFLASVRSTVLGALAHSDIPFDAIVRELAPQRESSRHPLFQVLFSMRPPFADFPEGWDVTDMEAHSASTGWDLFVEFSEHPDSLAGRFVYSTDLFDPATIQRLQTHFHALLERLLANPDSKISEVTFLTEHERHTLLVDWNNTAKAFPDVRIHELLEAQAAANPDRCALVFRGRELTYGQLNARANQLAHWLRHQGATNGSLIGVLMERSFEMVVALFAILKSGAAYVPYDPELPASRLNMMLEDSKPVCVITQQNLNGKLAGYAGQTLTLDAQDSELIAEPDSNPRISVSPKDAIYAIYTSGSTGAPKAAVNTHEAVANRILWMQDRYRLQSNDRVLQKTPYSFDVSVWEFFWPMAYGATLVIAEPGGHRDPAYIADLIGAERITTIHFVPSMLREFLNAQSLDRCGTLQRVFASGEALPPDLRQKFFERLGALKISAELHNLYGPTEAAVDVTYWDCSRETSCASVPIGRPIANVKTYILDQHLAPVPIGVAGELHIGGIAVGRGYLNRDELTRERFIPDPFEKRPGARLYKTGDRARFLADGNIEYLGRYDQQIKLRGFRIELGEIEASLLQSGQVQAAAVLLKESASNGPRLVAYVVPAGAKLDASALRAFLRGRLPEHMIPSAFVALESLPTTASGKLARKALPEPDFGPDARREFVGPQDDIEERLTNIWQDVLGVYPVSVTANYFDLGGHSFLALRLFSEIKFCFRVDLPLGTLFYAPTVRTLAAIIRDAGVEAPSTVIPIQPNGSKPAIYCIGALNGELILFRPLALELGQDQPLFGLQPFSLVDRLSTVEELAAAYIEQLQLWGEHRPFCLLGYSFGGLVAVEMARQLRKSGAKPPLVVMIDSNYVAGSRALEPWKDRIRRYRYHVDWVINRAGGLAHLRQGLQRRLFRVMHKVSTSVGVGTSSMASDIAGRQLLAAENWRAKSYPGRVWLFKAESGSEFLASDPGLGWTKLLSDLRLEGVPGDHGTINTGANLKILAQKLTAALDEWDRAQNASQTAATSRVTTESAQALPN